MTRKKEDRILERYRKVDPVIGPILIQMKRKRLKVDKAFIFDSQLSIHRRNGDSGWTVTHLGTGRQIGAFRDKRHAVNYVRLMLGIFDWNFSSPEESPLDGNLKEDRLIAKSLKLFAVGDRTLATMTPILSLLQEKEEAILEVDDSDLVFEDEEDLL